MRTPIRAYLPEFLDEEFNPLFQGLSTLVSEIYRGTDSSFVVRMKDPQNGRTYCAQAEVLPDSHTIAYEVDRLQEDNLMEQNATDLKSRTLGWYQFKSSNNVFYRKTHQYFNELDGDKIAHDIIRAIKFLGNFGPNIVFNVEPKFYNDALAESGLYATLHENENWLTQPKHNILMTTEGKKRMGFEITKKGTDHTQNDETKN